MVKALNVRLVGGLAAAVVALGVSGYFLHGYQTGRNAGAYLREGRRAREENRPQEALRHLSRYVKLAPHDTEGLALYGSLLKDLGQAQPAYLALGQAVRREPGRDDLRRQLVELEIALGRHADAKRNLVERPEGPGGPPNPHALLKKFPRDGGLWIQLGVCDAALAKTDAAGEIAEAVAAFEKAIAVSPERLEGYLLLAELLARAGDRDGAERALGRMVENNPKDHLAYVVRGRRRLQGRGGAAGAGGPPGPADAAAGAREEQAWEDARRALELAPDDADVLLFAGDAAVRTGRRDEALGVAERALGLRPADPRVYTLLADVEAAGGDRAAAADWLRRGVSAVPDDTGLRWNWAHLLIEQGRVAEASRQFEALRRDGHAPAAVSYLEARAAIAESRWLDGVRRLEKVRRDLAEWPDLQKQADLWAGRCYRELGDVDRQLAAYRQAAATDPSWVPARMGVADALLAAGRLEEAQAEYRRIAETDGVRSAAPLKLAHVLVAANLRRDPAQRDWAAPERLLDGIEASQPGTPEVVLLRAEMLVARERAGEAERLLAEAREKDPGRLEFRAAEVALAQRGADWPRVERLLEDAEAHVGDTVGLRLLEARGLALRLRGEAPAELRELWEASSGGLPPGEAARLADGVANLALAVGDPALASELASVAAAARPNDLRVRLLLLDAASRGGGRVEPVLAELRRIEGEGPTWHYGEALRLTAAAKGGATGGATGGAAAAAKGGEAPLLERAEAHLAAAKEARPGWSRLPLLSAEIAELRGDDRRAAEAYLEAISLGERRPGVVGRAIGRLLEQQRVAEADRLVRRLQEQHAAFTGDLARLAAETSLRLEDYDRALALAESVAAGSEEYRDHVWFAQVLARQGRTEEAERELRRAIELAPEAPEPWVSLVQVLAEAGRAQDAEKAIAEAREAVDGGRAFVTVAQCHEILGRIDAADAGYREAMARSPGDPGVARRAGEFFLRNKRIAQAEEVLRRVVAGETKGSEDDVRWARRNLALITGARGAGGYAEAVALLEANSAGETSRADRRAKAMIWAMQPFRGPRTRAIEALEGLLADDRTASADDRFVLAELYRREGQCREGRDAEAQYAKAADQLLKVLQAEPDEPRYVTAYVRLLLDRKVTVDVELWLDRLKSLAPGDLSTKELEAEALFVRERDAELTELLASAGAAAPAGDGTSPEPRLWAAERLEHYADEARRAGRPESAGGFASRAESLLAAHARGNPADGLLLAAFLARQGRLGEALGLLPERVGPAEARHVPALVAAVVTSADAKPDDLKRVQSVLEASLEGGAGPAVLGLAVADLRSWRGDYVAAEEMYRRVLRADGRHVAAMNNLAVVMALGLGRHDEALRLVQSAIGAAGPAGALLDTRGLIHLSAGRAEDARTDFEQAVAEEPAAADRHLHLALALGKLGESEASKAELGEARRLGLTDGRLHPLERSAMREFLVVKR